MITDDDRALMRSFRTYLEHVDAEARRETRTARTPLGDLVSEHLGADAASIAVVEEQIVDHRLVDADIALEALAAGSGRVVGVSGGDQRQHGGFAELISSARMPFAAGPVDYAERATGPDSSRSVVSFGVRLLTHEGAPVAVLQRAASPRTGREQAVLEVMGVDPRGVSSFLERLRAMMVRLSVLRGRVLSFVPTEYGRDAGATFLVRPVVDAAEIVLPEGVLEEVAQHVVGIGEHREALRAAGQHLKRGVLLYGPPGTGKTLTVRHLLTRSPDTTAVLLTGTSIRYIAAAAEIARTLQPSIVVLEDIDLVAMERHTSPQPLLFEVLDALDGLDGDADVAFVMTTNRVEVLERALAERPGRVDLAVEVPRPALVERVRLFRHYARELPYSDEALTTAAERAAGTTGSFAKELMRRSVLRAAIAGAPASDDDLVAALDELLAERGHLTRRMLGGDADPAPEAPGGTSGGYGWFAGS